MAVIFFPTHGKDVVSNLSKDAYGLMAKYLAREHAIECGRLKSPSRAFDEYVRNQDGAEEAIRAWGLLTTP